MRTRCSRCNGRYLLGTGQDHMPQPGNPKPSFIDLCALGITCPRCNRLKDHKFFGLKLDSESWTEIPKLEMDRASHDYDWRERGYRIWQGEFPL